MPSTYPLLKYYNENPLTEVAQKVLNDVTRNWDSGPFYAPPELIKNVGRQTFDKLESAGFMLDPDGKYGRLTEGRIKIYQHGKGLNPDGKIGSTETWPALEKDFAAMRSEAIKKAMTNLPNLSDATQIVSGGTDCGYFAAYAVAKTVKGSATLLNFDRKDVLAARDTHDRTIAEEWLGKERTTTQGMGRDDAAPYLAKLGAPGFSNRKISAATLATADALEGFLDARSNGGWSPMMVLLPKFISAADGHWVGILGKQVVANTPMFLLYDSSGEIVRSMKAKGWPGGTATMWLFPEDLRYILKFDDADQVVSKY